MAEYQRKLKKGIRWWYKFDYNGKTYASYCIYLTKNEAKKAENAKYEEVSNQERNPSQKPILSLLEAINERLDYVEIKKSKDYYKDNKRYYKLLLEEVGDILFTEVKKSKIEDLLLKTSKKQKAFGRDNYVINSMLNVYKALFNYIIDKHDLNMKNPCNKIAKFSINKKLKYIPSGNDIEAVKAICDNGQIMLIEFVMETACRISEAIRVTGKDILEDSVILYTKKSLNSNLVPRKMLKPECVKNIILKPDERLFNRWSDCPRFLEDKVRELGQRNWSWHNLRHRKASIWHNKEKRPLYEVMVLLGHSNLKTTQGYLQLVP
jgi:integrase